MCAAAAVVNSLPRGQLCCCATAAMLAGAAGRLALLHGGNRASVRVAAHLSPTHHIMHATVHAAGEGHRQDIDDIVAAALEYYGEKGQLDDTPLPVSLERERDPRLAASPLRFPGGSKRSVCCLLHW